MNGSAAARKDVMSGEKSSKRWSDRTIGECRRAGLVTTLLVVENDYFCHSKDDMTDLCKRLMIFVDRFSVSVKSFASRPDACYHVLRVLFP